jgi:hypothetical protein
MHNALRVPNAPDDYLTCPFLISHLVILLENSPNPKNQPSKKDTMSGHSQKPTATALLNLEAAIKTTSEERLRALLTSICKEIPEASQKVVKELFVDSSTVKNLPRQIAGIKRPISRYEHCGNCEKEFDITENSKTSCRYHPG